MNGNGSGDELERVSAVLGSQPDLILAFAFGSVAANQAHADSDIDIAVLAAEPLDTARTMELIDLISKETGRPVDLIDLREAGPLIGQQVIKHGRDMHVRSNEDLAAFISRTIIDAADFLPIVDSAVKASLDKWTRE